MEIQNIPGFKLRSTTVTGSPPYSRFPRGRGGASGSKRWKTPAEVKTLDFGAGLEAYIPPRVSAKRPNSSRQRQRSKEISSQDTEIQFDVEDVHNKEAFTSEGKHQSDDSYKVNQSVDTSSNINQSFETTVEHGDDVPVVREENPRDLHRLANATHQEWNDRAVQPNSPHVDWSQSIHEPGLRKKVGKFSEIYVSLSPNVRPGTAPSTRGVDLNFHGQQPSKTEPPPSPQQWFEKTLQQYEDLKKFIYAQMSSVPSSISERIDTTGTLVEPAKKDTHSLGAKKNSCSATAEGDANTSSVGPHLNLHGQVSTPRGFKQEALNLTNMPREGRPLWERPEHATGKYLIHDTSAILVESSTSDERGNPVEKKFKTKRTGNTRTYSCGCPAGNLFTTELPVHSCGCPNDEVHGQTANQSPYLSYKCQQRTLPTTDQADRDNAMTWNQLVDNVTQLSNVNKGLQSTIEELIKPESFNGKQCQQGRTPILIDWHSITKEQLSSIGLCEPKVRKQVLSTLRSSVQKMQSLMQSLKEEQAKSEILSGKLSGFLTAKSERGFLLLGPSPIVSRSTSPDQATAICRATSPLSSSTSPSARRNQDSDHVFSLENDPKPNAGGLDSLSSGCKELYRFVISNMNKTREPPQSLISNQVESSLHRRESYRFEVSNLENNSQDSLLGESTRCILPNSETNCSLPSCVSSQSMESPRFILHGMEKNNSHQPSPSGKSPPPTSSNVKKSSSQPSSLRELPQPIIPNKNKSNCHLSLSRESTPCIIFSRKKNSSQPPQESPPPVISNKEKVSFPISPRIRKPSQAGVVYSI